MSSSCSVTTSLRDLGSRKNRGRTTCVGIKIVSELALLSRRRGRRNLVGRLLVHKMRSSYLSAFVALSLLDAATAQDQNPTTISVASTVQASSTISSSTFSVSQPATTTSIPPTFPTSISATYSPFPTPSGLHVPGALPDVVYAVTPGAPLPVQDPKDGPWLVPDFEAAWDKAWAKAKEAISTLPLELKVNITTGTGWQNGLCVGNIFPIPNVLPSGICLQDSPLGVRFADGVSAFPTGINAAATWSRSLLRARGVALGREFRGKGVNVALGPMMNLGRVAQGGRNWEGFGADPYLAGEASYETILGMQSAGVQACAKHYIDNEQEHARTHSSSDVDDRTQHEVYAHPFLRSVMAGVASVMCSYNLINSSYACENDKMLNDVLKREFGFRGYVQSDWAATHSTLSIVAGLDMTMPGDITFKSGDSYFGGNLTAYVQNGTIPEGRVDDAAARVLAAYYLLEQDDDSYPETNFNSWDLLDDATNNHTNVQADHWKLIREIGAASTVLLKNVNGTLPLHKPRSIAVIGSDAGLAKNGPNFYSDRGGADGILGMGWGSGTTNYPYLISPLEAFQSRVRQDGTSVSWFLNDFDTAGAASAAKGAETAVVFVQSDSGEEYITVDGNEGDRKNLTLWHGGEALISAVASSNPNVIVVVHAPGPIVVEEWIEHPNVTAVLWAGMPGQEAGTAIVDVLYGSYNPTGRLPYTIAKRMEDYSAQLILGGTPAQVLDIPYEEKLLIDYRWFDAKNISPRFEFGFGLSYTTFDYSNLHTYILASFEDSTYAKYEEGWAAGEATPIEQGSSAAPWLHAPAFSLEFDIQNTGSVYGGDIPQVYLHFPESANEPPSVLRGFTNVALAAGAKTTVVITLSRYDLSIWDVEDQGWKKPEGEFHVSVGASSRDLRLKGTIPLSKEE